jgi:hypothetical protein
MDLLGGAMPHATRGSTLPVTGGGFNVIVFIAAIRRRDRRSY